MTLQELQQFHTHPIHYRIADQIGSGTLLLSSGQASITASSADDGVEGVEPIRLTADQCAAIEEKDGVLTLEG